MQKKPIIITTDSQLNCCILNEINIEVWIKDFCDYKGKIISYSEDEIKVEDGFFLREFCVVKTKENIFKRVV
ncbi:hypothetical protein [Paenibacillus qinlingensis]|uniref:hypothetical protein n=1 Tax=Paenibacillus qinlingensis TaxID=1837343 RepID=UPI00156474BD|nr:hypothetical protein [Paenibacillus qinlingensis]NQX63263.1 hypothetical protein [Paenibacillus qinlingensis]